MPSAVATSAREGIGSEAGDVRNQAIELDDPKKKVEWWKTMFKVVSQIESLELKDKFSGIVESDDEERRQLVQLLNEYHRYREESERENGDLKTEIAKLKLDFDGVKCQNDNLQQLLHERCENLSITPQKRRRNPEDDDDDYVDEDDNNDRPPRYKRVKTNPSGFSRERIKYVLGGRDRGWGSTQCRPQVKYTYHALLDVKAHFFDQRPSSGEHVAEAVFGFHDTDDEVISGEIEFPLFVRDTSENPTQFQYMGNYVAKKSYSVAWQRLSQEGRDCAIQTVRFKGLSDKCNFYRVQRGSAEAYIRRQFDMGTYKVPCCRLEFRGFDQNLKADVQASPNRVRP